VDGDVIALIDSNGQLVAIVASIAGVDMTGLRIVDPVPEPIIDYVWDTGSQVFVTRPPTAHEQTQADLDADPRWQSMRTATPAQVDNWLTANVTDLASARRVLKLLILAVQLLARTR